MLTFYSGPCCIYTPATAQLTPSSPGCSSLSHSVASLILPTADAHPPKEPTGTVLSSSAYSLSDVCQRSAGHITVVRATRLNSAAERVMSSLQTKSNLWFSQVRLNFEQRLNKMVLTHEKFRSRDSPNGG